MSKKPVDRCEVRQGQEGCKPDHCRHGKRGDRRDEGGGQRIVNRAAPIQRHGTTSLFAALQVATGKVTGKCFPRHTNREFLSFLKLLDRKYRHRDLHLICDNYGTHKHPVIKKWFADHPRFHLHLTPTSASWLNLVERWFARITQEAIRRGTFISVRALERAILGYLATWNENPKPFVWTKTASQIHQSIHHAKKTFGTGH
jgi:transposase